MWRFWLLAADSVGTTPRSFATVTSVAYFMLYVLWLLLLLLAVVVKYLCRIPHSMRDSQIFHALCNIFYPTSRPRERLIPQPPTPSSPHFRLPRYTLLSFNFLRFFGLSTQSPGVSLALCLVALWMVKAALMACVVAGAGAGGFTCREQKFTSTARFPMLLMLLVLLLFSPSPSPSSLSLPLSFLLLLFIFRDFYFSRYSDSRKYLAGFTLVRIQTHNNSNNDAHAVALP